jgi:hypothetical protein
LAGCLRAELLDFFAGAFLAAFLAVLLREEVDFFAGLVERDVDLRGLRDADVDFLVRELPLDLRAEDPELELPPDEAPRDEDPPDDDLEREDWDFAADFLGRELSDDLLRLDADVLLRADRPDGDLRGADFPAVDFSADALRGLPRLDLRVREVSPESSDCSLEDSPESSDCALELDDRFRGRRPAWSSAESSEPSSPESCESLESSSSGPFTTSPSRISPRHEPLASFCIITNRRKFFRSSRVRRPAARQRFPVFSNRPLG